VEGDPKDAPAPIDWPKGGWEIQPEIVMDLRRSRFQLPIQTPAVIDSETKRRQYATDCGEVAVSLF
jgi:hypothetical protein